MLDEEEDEGGGVEVEFDEEVPVEFVKWVVLKRVWRAVEPHETGSFVPLKLKTISSLKRLCRWIIGDGMN